MDWIENDLASHYEYYKSIIKELTLMSDAFMRNVLKDPACAEYVLQVILEKKNLKVVDVVVQQDNKNRQGRPGVLDCVVQDEDGELFDVEVQQENEGASPQRARYHSGLLDMNTLNPGDHFDRLAESYVIFITRDDVLGKGLPIYHIERIITETGDGFGDRSHIIYVNASIQDATELGQLMRDFHCKNADEMHSEVLADRVRALKETQGGVESMCREMEQIYQRGESRGIERGRVEGRKEGRAEGRVEQAKETALNLAAMGLSAEQIANAVKTSIQLVQEWLNGSTAEV